MNRNVVDRRDYRLSLYEKAMPDHLSWAERLEEARVAGFDEVEISIDETDGRLARLLDPAGIGAELRAAGAATGVRVRSMCLSGHRKYPLGSHDLAIRRRSLEIMRQAVAFAAETGIRIIQLAGYDVYYEESDDATRAWFAEGLAEATRIAAAAGIPLGFETMETPFLDTVTKAMHWVRAINSPYLGVYPDLGNLTNAALITGVPVVTDLQAGAGHLFAAHLKETRPGVYRNLMFGEGHTDFAAGIAEFWRQGLRRYCGEFWLLTDPEDKDAWRADLRRAGEFLRTQIDAVAAAPVSGSAAASARGARER